MELGMEIASQAQVVQVEAVQVHGAFDATGVVALDVDVDEHVAHMLYVPL